MLLMICCYSNQYTRQIYVLDCVPYRLKQWLTHVLCVCVQKRIHMSLYKNAWKVCFIVFFNVAVNFTITTTMTITTMPLKYDYSTVKCDCSFYYACEFEYYALSRIICYLTIIMMQNNLTNFTGMHVTEHVQSCLPVYFKMLRHLNIFSLTFRFFSFLIFIFDIHICIENIPEIPLKSLFPLFCDEGEYNGCMWNY